MSALKFGLVLPYGAARVVAQLCQIAEGASWDGCFLGDAIWCEDPMIALAAAAMVTQRIRLGTMIIPMPLRRPWKVASESADIRAMKAYVEANRTLTTLFDIVVSGKTADLDRSQLRDTLMAWEEAGATWWIEGLWGEPEERVIERIRKGPPRYE